MISTTVSMNSVITQQQVAETALCRIVATVLLILEKSVMTAIWTNTTDAILRVNQQFAHR